MTQDTLKTDYDIAIVGGGGAGLSCAHALAKAGLTVLCLDRRFGFDGEKSNDTRTIALLHSSVTFLKNMGLWDDLRSDGEALKVMSLKDRTGRSPQTPDMFFDSSELDLEAFGYNIANATLVSHLAQKAQDHERITCQETAGVRSLTQHKTAIEVITDDTQSFTVKLVIGADGAQSLIRGEAGIETQNWSYNQSAVACWFSHSTPHHNVSTEFHHQDGPLVVVPMQGNNCGLVWVEKPEESQRILALSDDDFCHELQNQTENLLGNITNASVRSLFPLSGLTAQNFVADRIALIGHAAHVVPPIGAQGLNMGFRDSATIAQIITQAHKAGQDIGSASVLKSYDTARRNDVLSRTFAIDMMNRSLISGAFPPIHFARGLGVHMLKNIAPLRKLIMRQGMGLDADMPILMRA